MEKLFLSNKDESVRMFKSDLMDKLSRVHWSVPLYIFVPVVLFFLYMGLFEYQLGILYVICLYALGVFIWTATEYILHRFVFHYMPPGKWGERINFMFHGVHHAYPNDSKRLVMVPAVSIPLAFAFYGLFYWIFDGHVYTAPAFSGLVTGYLVYDMTHYALHHVNSSNKWFMKLKKHHMKHHYQDPDHGYGVSNFLWDHIFRTMFKDSKAK